MIREGLRGEGAKEEGGADPPWGLTQGSILRPGDQDPELKAEA